MVVIILANSISLALYDYNDRDSNGSKNKILDKMNVAYTIIFTIEAVMKMIAKGLIIHKDSYLRSGWNIIDIVVVISG
jgi:hypothetical protein